MFRDALLVLGRASTKKFTTLSHIHQTKIPHSANSPGQEVMTCVAQKKIFKKTGPESGSTEKISKKPANRFTAGCSLVQMFQIFPLGEFLEFQRFIFGVGGSL